MLQHDPDAPDSGSADEPVLNIGEFRLDLHLRSLYRGDDDDKVKITARPFSTLEYLVKNRHRVVSKAELLDKVWGGQREVSAVEHVIGQLRRALGDSAEDARYIETVPGQGYRLIAEVRDPQPKHDGHAPPPRPESAGPKAADLRRSRRILISSLAVAAALVACLAAYTTIRHFARQPRVTRISLSGNTLAAMDPGGAILWTYEFDAQLSEPPPGENGPWRTQIVDLDGDGAPEVLVAARFDAQDAISHDELFCFSARGRLLWRFQPASHFKFDNWEVSGPWVFRQLVVVPENGSRSIYLAVNHSPWWPSFVVRISPSGLSKVVFVSSGNVRALRKIRMGSHDYLLAAGSNNEYSRASIAVLALDGPPSTSPQSEPKFQCLSGCPAGRPFRYILLPRSEMSVASDVAYNVAFRIDARPGGITVLTDETGGWGAMYEFSQELQPERMAWGDNYSEIHRQFELEGRLKHSYQQCPERKTPAILNISDENGNWRAAAVPRTP